MKPRVILATVFVLGLPTGALADVCGPTEELLFHCKINDSSRQVSTCQSGDGLFVYRYGKPGQEPELTLSATPAEVDYTPWNGVGRYIWATLTFDNKGYRYQLAYSVDKNTSTEEGFLNVFEPGADEPSFSRSCRPGSIDGSLDGLDLD